MNATDRKRLASQNRPWGEFSDYTKGATSPSVVGIMRLGGACVNEATSTSGPPLDWRVRILEFKWQILTKSPPSM